MKFKACVATALLAVSVTAMAASGGIRNNRNNECSIWLCLPGGFPGGCESAYSAMVGRITDLAPHHVRKYNTLPDFANCVDYESNDQQYAQLTSKLGITPTNMTYTETNVAYIPEHKICTGFVTWRECYDGSCETKRKCVTWQTIPESYVENTSCSLRSWWDESDWIYDDVGQIIGSRARPEWCSKTLHRIKVFGDREMYGTHFDYKE